MSARETTTRVRGALPHGLRRRIALVRARRRADRELLVHTGVPARLAWRAAELAAPSNRLSLASSVRKAIDDADPRYLPGASPLNRPAVRLNAMRLTAIALRLEALDQPVGARGVLLVDRMLTDGSGPLYDPEAGKELAERLDSILVALEAGG